MLRLQEKKVMDRMVKLVTEKGISPATHPSA